MPYRQIKDPPPPHPTPIPFHLKTGKQTTALVISPLKALIQDQVASLTVRGIKAVAFTEDSTPDDYKGKRRELIQLLITIISGYIDILFVTPEMLSGSKQSKLLHLHGQICLLAFDECHCISQWGYDFRPDYLKVCSIVSQFPHVPTVLLTSTATTKIMHHLFHLLALDAENTRIVSVIPDRPNIFIRLEEPSENYEQKLEWIVNGIREHGPQWGKTLIYFRNLKNCEDIFIWMLETLQCEAYRNREMHYTNRMIEMFHSRSDKETRDRILTEFKEERSTVRVICSTLAFGLGVDIPDIVCVVLWGVPNSILPMWQEMGRAGRNGCPAKAIVYPFGRSLALCPDKDMKDLVQTKSCIRLFILKMFVLDGMLDDYKVSTCNDNCNACECSLCKCCSNCASTCKCKGK